jgi:DNA (cytosine-5)-methyltransferase 1
MATQGVAVPEIAGTLKACGGKSGGWSNSVDHAAAGYMVPVVAGSLSARDGKGFDRGDMHQLSKLVPSVAGCLQERDAKGTDSDTKPRHLIAVNSGQGYWREDDKSGTLGTGARAVHENNLVPVAFGGNVARTLNARHDSIPCADRGMDVVAQGTSVRRLTPTECERLQSFPDGWTDGFADSVRYRMLGNAVCVNVAEWIAKRLVKATTKKGNM